jgi:hypothetical protein
MLERNARFFTLSFDWNLFCRQKNLADYWNSEDLGFSKVPWRTPV